MIPGIDVSHWNTITDWHRVAKSKRFAFIKATEATNYQDVRYKANYAGAKAAGMYAGAYHFFRPRYSGYSQAVNFLRTVTIADGDIPPVLDLEVSDGMGKTTVMARAREWFDAVEDATGVKPILYSSVWFLNAYFTVNNKPPAWADGIRLWIANWRSGSQPLMPKGWTSWAFWQYSDRGRVDGIRGYVDLDWYNSELKEDD